MPAVGVENPVGAWGRGCPLRGHRGGRSVRKSEKDTRQPRRAAFGAKERESKSVQEGGRVMVGTRGGRDASKRGLACRGLFMGNSRRAP